MKKSELLRILTVSILLLVSLGCNLSTPGTSSTVKTQNALAVEQTKLDLQKTAASGQGAAPTNTQTPPGLGPTNTSPPPILTATSTTAPPTHTVTPTFTNTYHAGPGFNHLIDYFTDPTSGWPENNTADYSTWYHNEHYHIEVNQTNMQFAIPSGYTMANGTVTTYGLIMDQASSPQAYQGVVCRFQDYQNYYFFEVAYDGSYRIGKFVNGVYSLIGMNAPKTSTAISAGDYKTIKADCFNEELSLSVNDVLIETVKDMSFATGDTGLCASAGNVPGIIAAFNYFMAEEY